MSDGAEDEEACPPGRLNRARWPLKAKPGPGDPVLSQQSRKLRCPATRLLGQWFVPPAVDLFQQCDEDLLMQACLIFVRCVERHSEDIACGHCLTCCFDVGGAEESLRSGHRDAAHPDPAVIWDDGGGMHDRPCTYPRMVADRRALQNDGTSGNVATGSHLASGQNAQR